jgi:Domain of unknown function (DUF4136)
MNRLVAILVLTCAISPVAASKARVDFCHACDFSRYQTYRWAGPPNADYLNQLMQQRVVAFVEEALSARKLKRVEKGGDLVIDFQMNVREQPVFTTFSNSTGFGWDFGWGSSIATTTTEVVTWGTLTVDLVDSHGNRLVFQGVSTTAISSRPSRNTRRLERAVNEIFEKYPPR